MRKETYEKKGWMRITGRCPDCNNDGIGTDDKPIMFNPKTGKCRCLNCGLTWSV